MIASPPGILPDHAIRDLAARGAIRVAAPFDADQVQPASLDLRLGAKAWRIRASFLPGPQHLVADRLSSLVLHEIDLTAGAVLETGCVYLVELMESLTLDADLSATTNPKSSTGRIDVFTRVICDRGPAFDAVPAGYHGPLYAEVSPQTFPILARKGSRLSQIRFRRGKAELSMEDLTRLQATERLVATPDPIIGPNGIGVSIDLKGDPATGLVGYRAKRHTALVDVDKRAACAIADFWEPIHAHPKGELILDPDEFYILVSKEALCVPPNYAAEMVPFDPGVGEFRVHYAGFFDPVSAIAPQGVVAREACWKCARARCPSSWSMARSSHASFMSICAPSLTSFMDRSRPPIIRHRA